MEILDQKLGSVGEVKVELVGGKIVISAEEHASLDLVAQLDKLAAAHTSGALGEALKLADAGLKAVLPKE